MPICAKADSKDIHALVSAAAAQLSSERGLGVVDVLLFKPVASMLQALLEAEGKGEIWKVLGLPAAPHLIGVDGEVRVPDCWKKLIYVQQQKAPRQQPGQLRAPTGHLPAPQSAAKSCDTKNAGPAGQVLQAACSGRGCLAYTLSKHLGTH